ncbi:Fusaric acid resistance protein-like-domain-containing protein [Dactylonectria estremocensis]|uniref:Fusaric acid resistance protein-like-domain-containing protein n=1 Tax=Dactylonectria estremocensis TaxID=1079267 RepID=A0A9P9F0I8_9HYPO|nr:Fusaric acid resistance protein-like-domain-containing protein [Dactylonectria estremocensis]
MSSNGSSSTAAWLPNKRPSQRTKLKNGTFIVPRTGERSRQEFSLRTSTIPSTNASPTQYQSYDLADTFTERLQIAAHNVKVAAILAWAWLQTDEGHGVLKCTLAYILGSMGTFFPPLSNFLGNRDGKHVTATLTVYFHPARTVGSMLEAVLIAIVAVIYAEIVSLLSMGIAIVFRAQFGITAAAHALILIVCIGGGLGFVGWVKQKLNNPLVNVGTTLCSIAIISVITKEEGVHGGYFSDDKIVQVIKMLVIGITFTVAVNVLVWKISARHVLRKSIMMATTSLGDKLSSITKGFLSGTEDELWSTEYSQVSAKYNSAYATMSSVLREAKTEHYFFGRESIYRLDRRLVRSIEVLSQAIGGLRSSLETQFTLLREVPHFGDRPRTLSSSSSMISPTLIREASASTFFDTYTERLAVIEESGESEEERRMNGSNKSDIALDKAPVFHAPSDIFAVFIELLGPSIKSLVHTLSEILREPAFGKDPNADITVNEQLRESLRDALSLYNSARADSLQELYRIIELGRARSEKIQADIEEVAAACGHFSFSLQAVAEETDAYLDVLEDLKYTTDTGSRSWCWLKFWQHLPSFRGGDKQSQNDPEAESLIPKPPVQRLKKSQIPKGIPDAMVKRRDTFSWDAAPQASKFKRAFSERLLNASRFFVREDILFGIKVGIGALLWAMLAFIPSTRPAYQKWRGEWGLLSFMIVAGMTTGAANTTGTARFKGTLVGAACAITSWTLSQGNPIALVFLGGIVALCNFYWILAIKNAPLGRIALLAYNVSTLYAYSLSQSVDDDDDDEGGSNPLIFDIAFHRVVSVTLGILWGVIFCRLIWPISGRRKFREGLSVLYLQMGLIWKRGPLTVSLQSNNTMDYMREGEQAALQRYAFKLESLRVSAKSEFELRGPFPDASYARIMRSTKHILDGFYAMRLITQKRSTLSEGERALLEFTSAERKRLCERISHVFQVLASCIMLEYPLTDAIPTVENNKDRLLGKIYQFRKEHMGAELLGTGHLVVVEEKDYALLYAYTLVTLQVAAELNKVRTEIEGLFGVLHEESLLLQ